MLRQAEYSFHLARGIGMHRELLEWNMFSQPWLRLSCLTMAMFLASCMDPSPLPDPTSQKDLEPAAGSSDESVMTLQLSRSELGVLSEYSDELLIRVYSVENDLRVVGDGKEYRWSLTEDGIYRLQGLSLGLKEFEIILLDIAGQEIAKTVFRRAVGPGPQTLDKVVLQPTRRFEVPLNLLVQLNLVDFPGEAASQLSLPPAIDQILAAYSCYGCHSNTFSSGGLDLKTFPFQKDGQSLSNAESLARYLPILLDRVQDSQMPMPPFGELLKQNEVEEFASWLANIEAPAQGSGEVDLIVRLQLYLSDGGKLVTKLSSQGRQQYKLDDRIVLEAGKTYRYDIKVSDSYGAVWLSEADNQLVVPLNGALELALELKYEEPSVIIPIEVRR